MVVGTGFEPVKAKPADLQSAPVGHLGILPLIWSAFPELGKATANFTEQNAVEGFTPNPLPCQPIARNPFPISSFTEMLLPA